MGRVALSRASLTACDMQTADGMKDVVIGAAVQAASLELSNLQQLEHFLVLVEGLLSALAVGSLQTDTLILSTLKKLAEGKSSSETTPSLHYLIRRHKHFGTSTIVLC